VSGGGGAAPRWVGGAEVTTLLSMDACIDAMAAALAELSAGRAEQPVRTVLETPAGRLYVMPAALHSPPALVTKLITVVPSNAARGVPTHQGVIVAFDPETGAAVLMIDAGAVTAIRTAATSAAATRLLARADASVLALIGSGVQAGSHLDALARVRPLREVRVWSPTAEHREAFARRHDGGAAAGGARVRAVADAEAAVRGADVVCTATASSTPVVLGRWLAAGCHVNAVGASTAGARELDGAAIARARVFVESRAAAAREAGDLILAAAEGAIAADGVAGELGEVVAGTVPGRTAADQITIFKSLGQGVEDAAAVRLIAQAVAARR
jgi:alanine dehydrogenase